MATLSVDLTGKVALVTGAGRGIGAAIARALAGAGASVAVNDIDSDAAYRMGEALRDAHRAGGESVARAFPADVSDPAAVERMIADIGAQMGGPHIVVNNAGVEFHTSVLDTPPEEWQQVLNVNLSGPFYTSRAVAPIMQRNGGGVIVNIASIAGHNIPLRNRASYVASKAGLIGFTRACALEFAEMNIRVNTVCPGVIETEMTAFSRSNPEMVARWLADIPQGRLGQPEDVSGLVLYLCSDGAAYLTGQAINIDGGKVML